MKNLSLTLLTALSFLIAFLYSCKKEEADPLTELSITSKDTIFLEKGQAKKVDYHYNPTSGVEPDLAWKTSDKNIVSVDKDGTLHANNTGKATITLWVNDGTGLESTKTVYVFETPQISITGVSDVTYYSANFSLNYNLGGGDESNTTMGFVWDTVAQVNLIKNSGIFKVQPLAEQFNVDMFDPDGKIYVRAYIKTPLDTVYSESRMLDILPIPEGTLGNYMLNIPLAYGCVAKYKDWIYYISFKDTSDRYTNAKLYRVKEDLIARERLSNAHMVSSLNIIGSYIYCTGVETSSASQHRIMRIKLDGSKLAKYGEGFYNYNYSSWGPILVSGNYIYPSYSSGLFRFSADEKTSESSIGLTQSVNYCNNKLYFTLNKINNIDSLYTIIESNLDGSERKELYRGYHDLYFAGNGDLGIYKNSAYFIEKGIFKKFDLSSPDIVEILPISTYNYNIINDAIYFSNRDDAGKLYKCDLNGNLITKVTDDIVSSISVIDDYLYYYSGINLFRIKENGTGHQLID